MSILLDLALLFFDTVLVRGLHVHFRIILLMLLEVSVVRASLIVPLRIFIHVVSTLLRLVVVLFVKGNLFLRFHLL